MPEPSRLLSRFLSRDRDFTQRCTGASRPIAREREHVGGIITPQEFPVQAPQLAVGCNQARKLTPLGDEIPQPTRELLEGTAARPDWSTAKQHHGLFGRHWNALRR